MLYDIPDDALQEAYDESRQRLIRGNLDADAASFACYTLHEKLTTNLLRKAGIAEGMRVTVAFSDGTEDRIFLGFTRDWRTTTMRIKLASITKKGKAFKHWRSHNASVARHMTPAQAEGK